MAERFSIPAGTTRLRLVHLRRRSFRGWFLLEFALGLLCCTLFCAFMVLLLFVDGPAFDIVPSDIVGRIWNDRHHVCLECYGTGGELLQSMERFVEDVEERDAAEREALALARERGLPLVQLALGRTLASWSEGWSPEGPPGPVDSLTIVENVATWSQAPGFFHRLGLGSPASFEVTLTDSEVRIELGEGPIVFDRAGILAVRWGPVMRAGNSAALTADRLCIVSEVLTEALVVPDPTAGAALAAFIQRGIQAPCADSSSS